MSREHLIKEARAHLLGLNADEILELTRQVMSEIRGDHITPLETKSKCLWDLAKELNLPVQELKINALAPEDLLGFPARAGDPPFPLTLNHGEIP